MLLLPHFIHVLVDVIKKSFTKKKNADANPSSFTHDKNAPRESDDEILIEKSDSAELSLTQKLKLKSDTKIYHLPLFIIHCPFCPLPINSAPSTISVSEIVTYTKTKKCSPKTESERPADKTDRCHHGLMFKQERYSDVRFIPDEPYRSIGYPSNKFRVEPDKGFKRVNGGRTWMNVVNDMPVICGRCGQVAAMAMEIVVTFKEGNEQAKKWGKKPCRFLLVGPAE